MSPSDKPSDKRSLVGSGFVWSRRAGTLLLLVVVLLLVGMAVLWSTSGEFVAGQVAGVLNDRLFDDDTRLIVGRVGGFPLDHLVVEDVRLERRGADGWFPFVAAGRMRVSYDLWGIVHGRNDLRRIEADRLRFELREDGEGGYLLPGTGGGDDDDDGGGGGLNVRIPELTLRESSLLIDLPIRSLEMAEVDGVISLVNGDDGFRVEVDHLRGMLADELGAVVLERGAFVITESFAFEDLVGAWEDSPITADGPPGDGDRDLHLSVERFPLERLGRFLRLDNLGPGHVDGGRAHLTVDDGDLAFSWSGDGSWGPWNVENGRGRGVLRDRVLTLSETEGRMNGAEVLAATITVPLDKEGITVSAGFVGLQLENMPLPVLEPYPGTLTGSGTVSLGNRTDPMESLTARVSLQQGHVMEIPFRMARGVVRVSGGSVRLDTVRVSLEEAELRGRGEVGTETIDLGFRYQGDLKPWRRFLRLEDLNGTGTVDVILLGARERPELAASGVVTGLEVANLRAPTVALRRAEGVLAGGRHLELDFTAPEGLSLSGTPFSRAEGSVVVTDSLVTMDALELARGDTTVVMVGNLRWEPRVEIEVERAAAEFDGRSFAVESPGLIIYDNGLLSTSGIEVTTRRGSVNLSGDWDTREHRIEARAMLSDLDFSVFFPPEDPPSLRVGSASGELEMTGTFPVVNGRGDLLLKAVEWEGGAFDSLRTAFRVEDRTIFVDRLDTRLGDGRASLAGTIDLPLPIYETMEAMAVGPDLDPDQVLWDLDGELDDIRLAKWLAFMERKDRPSGWLDARVRVEGTAAHPRMRVGGEARGLVWRRFTADSVIARLRFDEEVLTVDTLTTWQNTHQVSVTGTAPLGLTLYPFTWEIPEREMNLLVDSDGGELNNLKLTPWVDEAEGTLRALILVTGTPQMPLLNGRAEVEGITVRPVKRDEVLENVRATIRFDRDLVTVEEARADLGGGTVTALGTYRLHASAEESYELQVVFDNAVARQEGEYAARVSGTLTLRPVVAKDGLVYPFAEGDIFAHRVEYAGSLEPQDIGQFEPQPILYSVSINAPDKIIVMTEDVNAVLGGELTVRQDVDSRSMLGELDILRGSYKLFLEEFEVLDGSLNWNDPSTIVPEMDIQAETASPPYRVLVDLTGRVDAPVITFSAMSLEDGSDSGLSQQQIIQRLAAGSVGIDPGSIGMGSEDLEEGETATGPGALEQGLVGASGLFKGPLERELARQLGVVDEVQIDIDRNERGEYIPMVGVRKWVTSELSIQYRQGLSRTFDQDLAVEYRLRRAIFLRGEVLRRERQGSIQATQQYNVDLKVRHEY